MTLCGDCAGGAERCAREGHQRSHEVTKHGDTRKRFLCWRCHQIWEAESLECCTNCKKEIA